MQNPTNEEPTNVGSPMSDNEQIHHTVFQMIDIKEANGPSGSSEIHLFGVKKAGGSIFVRVLQFQHYFYYPAPEYFMENDLGPLRQYINDYFGQAVIATINITTHRVTRSGAPIRFLQIFLLDHGSIKDVFTAGRCLYRGIFSSPETSYESCVPYKTRFMLDRQINLLTWLQVPAMLCAHSEEQQRVSICQSEVSICYECLSICNESNLPQYAPLRILCFDIEVDIRRDWSFPQPEDQAILQIGNMVTTYGDSISGEPTVSWKVRPDNTIFTLGSCSPIRDTQVIPYTDESDMLMAWKTFVLSVDPDVVVGYNIAQFDIAYLLRRAEVLELRDFPYLGRIRGSAQKLPTRRPLFEECPGYDGRLLLDVYQRIRELHPALPENGGYKLNPVAKRFLDDQKADIHFSKIPALQAKDADSRRELAMYCLKDVDLCLRLMIRERCLEEEMQIAKKAFVSHDNIRTQPNFLGFTHIYLSAKAENRVVADKSSFIDYM